MAEEYKAMEWQDYLDEMMADAKEYIDENYDVILDDLKTDYETYGDNYADKQQAFEELWSDHIWDNFFYEMALDITGNANGSYTYSSYKARQNVSNIIWDEDFIERLKDSGYDGVPMEKGPEIIDVIARDFAVYEQENEITEYAKEKVREEFLGDK